MRSAAKVRSTRVSVRSLVVPAFAMLLGVWLFEALASFLQAYIFVVLTGVYIGGSIHPEH